MRILVTVKRVPDPYSRIRLAQSGMEIETAGVKFEINPFDEIAIEEAVRIKERTPGTEVVVISIGGAECEEQLRKALAMGADRAILIENDQPLDPLGVAKILKAVVEKEQPNIVLMGKQAIDDDANQAGQMLAGLCGFPQATFASEISVVGDTLSVTRETDLGQETLEMPMPAVITADLRLNEPRYVALPGIIKARTKALERISTGSLGVGTECRVHIMEMTQPPARSRGRIVANVDELISALKDEARVIP